MTTEVKAEFVEESTIDVSKLLPYSACCCCISSCYFDYPSCLGCEIKTTCLCQEIDCKVCKTSNNPKEICICYEGSNNCIYPTTCIKSVTQIFCIDTRAAFPCDEEIPNLLTVCFITCCYKFRANFGFFKNIGELDPELDAFDKNRAAK